MMRRRAFIAGVAAAAVLRPSPGSAQQGKIPVVGVLVGGTPDPAPFLAGLRDGLRQLGYVEGQNIRLDIRSAEGKAERRPMLAAALVREKVDVFVGFITPDALAAKQATSTIPIVMAAVGAPVEAGLVASLAHPGGNVTGNSATAAEVAQKNLQILTEIVPGLRRVGLLLNAADPIFGKVLLRQVQEGAVRLKIALRPIWARNPGDLDAAFAAARGAQADGIIIQPSLGARRPSELALSDRLPAMSPNGSFPRAGGLASYSVDGTSLWPKVALFVDKILKGAKPADLPVEQPTRFKLAINLKTAKALGLTVPPLLLAQADEIIE